MIRIGRDALYDIVWLDDYSDSLSSLDQVRDAELKKCYECKDALINMAMHETWYAVPSQRRYYCERCFTPVDQSYIPCIKKKKMPFRLTVLINQIEAHPQFKELETLTKMHYAECAI